MPEFEDPDFRRWYECAQATFEFGDDSHTLDGDDEYSYDEYMSSVHSDGLSIHSIKDDASDATNDTINEYIQPVINADFYHQPQDVQLAIYASDVVTLKDRNQTLSKQLQRVTDSRENYKKENERKEYEIQRITEERDKALADKYDLKHRLETLVEETAHAQKRLQDERRRREKEMEAEKTAIEETLLAAKFELAKRSEKYDNLEFSVYQMRMENKKLKELSKVQTEQIHHLGLLLSRSGVKISSIAMESADLKYGKQRFKKQTLESKV